jgi:hypothetical protein
VLFSSTPVFGVRSEERRIGKSNLLSGPWVESSTFALGDLAVVALAGGGGAVGYGRAGEFVGDVDIDTRFVGCSIIVRLCWLKMAWVVSCRKIDFDRSKE